MFKFRLQRLLELREQREQQVAIRLNEAQSQMEVLERERVRLELLRDGGTHRAPGRQFATVGQYQNARYLVDRLNEEVERAHRATAAAAEDVRDRTQEFTVAMQERRVLDRMRERLLLGWRNGVAQQDRQTMDAIALSRFVRASRAEQDESEEAERDASDKEPKP